MGDRNRSIFPGSHSPGYPSGGDSTAIRHTISPKQPPRQMSFRPKEPVVMGMLHQPSACLHQPLLQARQLPVLEPYSTGFGAGWRKRNSPDSGRFSGQTSSCGHATITPTSPRLLATILAVPAEQ